MRYTNPRLLYFTRVLNTPATPANLIKGTAAISTEYG